MFPYTISDKGITVFIDGMPRMFAPSHPQFNDIREAVENDEEAKVRELVNIRETIFNYTLGRVKITGNTIFVDDHQISHGPLVERILEMISRGSKTVDAFIKFLDRLMNNPSKNSVDDLYRFIEHCNLPITHVGCFLAYKHVRHDYKDGYTGTFDNSIGQVVSMPRNEVDENRKNPCSNGLHVCSYDYLPSYEHNSHSHVMVVKVDPADVVAVPLNYNNEKMRCCRYEVVGEIHDWHSNRITPYYTDEYEDEDDLDEEWDPDFDGEDFDDDHDWDVINDHIDWWGNDPFEVSDQMGTPVSRNGKLSEAEVSEMIRKYKPLFNNGDITLTAIGEKFDVDRRTVSRIFNGELWSSVTGITKDS